MHAVRHTEQQGAKGYLPLGVHIQQRGHLCSYRSLFSWIINQTLYSFWILVAMIPVHRLTWQLVLLLLWLSPSMSISTGCCITINLNTVHTHIDRLHYLEPLPHLRVVSRIHFRNCQPLQPNLQKASGLPHQWEKKDNKLWYYIYMYLPSMYRFLHMQTHLNTVNIYIARCMYQCTHSNLPVDTSPTFIVSICSVCRTTEYLKVTLLHKWVCMDRSLSIYRTWLYITCCCKMLTWRWKKEEKIK